LVEREARPHDDPACDLLAPTVARQPGHRGLGDRSVPLQHLLDLAGVDLHPARDDQLLGTALDDELAGGRVAAAEGAGPEPTVLGERGLAAEIAAEHLWPAHLDLAVVREPHDDARQRYPDRACVRLAINL